MCNNVSQPTENPYSAFPLKLSDHSLEFNDENVETIECVSDKNTYSQSLFVTLSSMESS